MADADSAFSHFKFSGCDSGDPFVWASESAIACGGREDGGKSIDGEDAASAEGGDETLIGIVEETEVVFFEIFGDWVSRSAGDGVALGHAGGDDLESGIAKGVLACGEVEKDEGGTLVDGGENLILFLGERGIVVAKDGWLIG